MKTLETVLFYIFVEILAFVIFAGAVGYSFRLSEERQQKNYIKNINTFIDYQIENAKQTAISQGSELSVNAFAVGGVKTKSAGNVYVVNKPNPPANSTPVLKFLCKMYIYSFSFRLPFILYLLLSLEQKIKKGGKVPPLKMQIISSLEDKAKQLPNHLQ